MTDSDRIERLTLRSPLISNQPEEPTSAESKSLEEGDSIELLALRPPLLSRQFEEPTSAPSLMLI